MSYSQLTIKP